MRRAIFLVFLLGSAAGFAADQQWLRVSSDHFVVLTNAGERKGHEVAARFEQMRTVFGQLLMRSKVRMAEPVEVIALGSHADYAQLAPVRNGKPIEVPGFYLPGKDRVYIVLDASDPDSWRAVERSLATYLLNFNYPPTQAWFDEGFTAYFASLYFTPAKAELGADPGSTGAYYPPEEENQEGMPRSFAEVLRSRDWLPFAELLEMTYQQMRERRGEKNREPFSAESWMLVHYLLNRNKLEETGTYLGLVENQGIRPAQAVTQAYGMSPEQLEKAVKDYFHLLLPTLTAAAGRTSPGSAAHPQAVQELALPVSTDDVATSTQQVPAREGQALVEEMEVRIRERRAPAVEQLRRLLANQRTETLAAHRALAWAYLEQGETNSAFQELSSAVAMNSSDPWTRMGLALASYQSGEKGARVQGLANMMESLHIVLTRYPEHAEAYNLLGWARLVGGGANAALESMRIAVQLSPRSEDYQLRLAEAYIAAKKWENADGVLERLKLSENPQIAAAANKDLHEIPFRKKFGVAPAENAQASGHEATTGAENTNGEQEESTDREAEQAATPTPATPGIDRRPVQFLKAKLLSVDCSKAPEAVLTVAAGKRTLRLRTSNYESLLVMGRDKFSCGWKDVPVSVNYRAGGRMDGDLVSLELQ